MLLQLNVLDCLGLGNHSGMATTFVAFVCVHAFCLPLNCSTNEAVTNDQRHSVRRQCTASLSKSLLASREFSLSSCVQCHTACHSMVINSPSGRWRVETGGKISCLVFQMARAASNRHSTPPIHRTVSRGNDVLCRLSLIKDELSYGMLSLLRIEFARRENSASDILTHPSGKSKNA